MALIRSSYVDLTDLAAMHGRDFDHRKVPTEGQARAVAQRVALEINSIIAQWYRLPITEANSPAAFGRLAYGNALGTLYHIHNLQYSAAPQQPRNPWASAWRDWQKELGRRSLPDAVVYGGTSETLSARFRDWAQAFFSAHAEANPADVNAAVAQMRRLLHEWTFNSAPRIPFTAIDNDDGHFALSEDQLTFSTVRDEAVDQANDAREAVYSLLFGSRSPGPNDKILAAHLPAGSSSGGGGSGLSPAEVQGLARGVVKAKALLHGALWDYDTDLTNQPTIPAAFTAADAVAAIEAALPNIERLNDDVVDGSWRAEDGLFLAAIQDDPYTESAAKAASYAATIAEGPHEVGKHIAFRVPRTLYEIQPSTDDLVLFRISTGDDGALPIPATSASFLGSDDNFWYYDLLLADIPAGSNLQVEWDAPDQLEHIDIAARFISGLEAAIRAVTHGNAGGLVVLPHSVDAPTATTGVAEGTIQLVEPSVGAPYIIGLTTEEMTVENRGRGTVILDGASKDADWRGNGTIAGNTAADGAPFDISWSLGFVDGGDPRYQSITVAIRTMAVTQAVNPIFYVRVRRVGDQTWTNLGQLSFSRNTQSVSGATGTLASLDFSHQPRATRREIAAILQYHRGFEREYSSTADFRNIWEYKPATMRTPTGWMRLTPNVEPWTLIGNPDEIPAAKRPVDYDDVNNKPTIPPGVVRQHSQNVAITSLNQWADTGYALPSDYTDKLFRLVLGGFHCGDVLISGSELGRLATSRIGDSSNAVSTTGAIEVEVQNAAAGRVDTLRVGRQATGELIITCDLVRTISPLEVWTVN